MARQNKIIAIFGRKGSGKTTLIKNITRSCRRLIVVDPMSDFNNGKIIYTRSELYQEVQADTFRIVFRPKPSDENANDNDVDYVCDLAIALTGVTLVIDEVDNYCNSYYMSESLRWCVQYGRHYNLYIIISSRQANRVRNDITAQADHILTYRQQGKQALEYLAYFDDNNINNNTVINLDTFHYTEISGENFLDSIPELP